MIVSLQGRRVASRVSAPNATAALLAALSALIPAAGGLTAANPGDRPAITRTTALVEAARASRPHLRPPLPGTIPPTIPDTAQGRRGIRKRVLELDLLTEHEVETLLGPPRDRAAVVRGLRRAGVLIGLPHEGRRVYPAFQFLGARPHPIAAAVNLSLRADEDPWRAATWWVRVHRNLGRRPLDLLELPDDADRLLDAAYRDAPPR